jgi:hypothetical protein
LLKDKQTHGLSFGKHQDNLKQRKYVLSLKNTFMSGGDWKQMFIAAGNGDVELVAFYLRSGIDPNYQHPEFLSTALIESAQNGHIEVVELLLQNGADPSIKSVYDGLTALETARQFKHSKVVEILEKASVK